MGIKRIVSAVPIMMICRMVISQCSRNSSVSFSSKLGPLDKFFYAFHV